MTSHMFTTTNIGKEQVACKNLAYIFSVRLFFPGSSKLKSASKTTMLYIHFIEVPQPVHAPYTVTGNSRTGDEIDQSTGRVTAG